MGARFCQVQMVVKGRGEETMIAVYWVMEGTHCCHVGFLLKHLVMRATRYEGVLAQVNGVYPLANKHKSNFVHKKV